MKTGKTVTDLKKLTKQLAEAEKKANAVEAEKKALLKQIGAINKANKPKSIMDRVQGYGDILSILKADEKKDVIKIDKFDSAEIKVVEALVKKIRIAKVYNEGWLPKVGESRWYAWWRWVSSGFVFSYTTYDDALAAASSAARLCFKNDTLTRDAAQKFPDVEEAFITG